MILLAMLLGYWVLIFYSTHMPVEYAQSVEVSDKFLHVAAYAVLAVLLAMVLHCRQWAFWSIVPLVLMTTAVYGFVDETTQPWFGRINDPLDWLADQVGGVVGLLFFLLLRATVRTWRTVPSRTVPSQAQPVTDAG